MTDSRAIGVFDSGVGGLTVLSALLRHLPDEPVVYLGDTARVPYGTRSADVVVRYALNNARTLLSRVELKMLVVACNTVSAVALPALREALPIPVIGVIEPGARAAVAASRGGTIAVLGTAGTVRSMAYPIALQKLGWQGAVVTRACPLLVPLVEEGWTDGEVTDRVLERYLGDLPPEVDTAVLGCTHYPLLRGAVETVFSRRGQGEVAVVDGAEVTALEVKMLLDERDERAFGECPPPAFFVTDAPEQMATLAPRFLGAAVDPASIELVDVLMDGRQR